MAVRHVMRPCGDSAVFGVVPTVSRRRATVATMLAVGGSPGTASRGQWRAGGLVLADFQRLACGRLKVGGHGFRPGIAKSQKVYPPLDLDSGVSWCITRAREPSPPRPPRSPINVVCSVSIYMVVVVVVVASIYQEGACARARAYTPPKSWLSNRNHIKGQKKTLEHPPTLPTAHRRLETERFPTRRSCAFPAGVLGLD